MASICDNSLQIVKATSEGTGKPAHLLSLVIAFQGFAAQSKSLAVDEGSNKNLGI